MASFFKKKGGVGGGGGGAPGSSAIHMTDSEAALAQSDFNTDKILEIQNKFTRGSSLLYPGRIFIREGVLWKVCRKGPKKRQFFLFNDILVYGSVVANRYSDQHVLPLSQMSVTAECFYQPRADTDFDEEFEQLELDVANAFQICHADKSFHVFALSSADKTNWVNNLHKHISRVALSLSGDQQLLTKPVWVPDSSRKDCMVCSVKFTPFIRKHHCRQCGRVICTSCSPYRVALDGSSSAFSVTDNKKMERICKDCFRDRSTHAVRRASGGGKPLPTRPPPPSMAAKAVSEVIQSTIPHSNTVATTPGSAAKAAESNHVPSEATGHHDSSTDTEDSDDSDEENNMDNVELAESTNQPTSVPHALSAPVTAGSCTNGREEREESQRTGYEEAESQPTGDQEAESQPTPPPRKKRLKKKLEEILTKEMESVKISNKEVPSQSEGVTEGVAVDGDQVVQDTVDCSEQSITPTEQLTMEGQQDLTADTSPKKNRRRRKHAGHAEQTTQATVEQTTQRTVEQDEATTPENRTASDDHMTTTTAMGDSSREHDHTVPDSPPLRTNSEQASPSRSGPPHTCPPGPDDQGETHPPGSDDQVETHPPGSDDQGDTHPPGSDDQVETHPPELHGDTESADAAGTDDRKKRGRRNKFK